MDVDELRAALSTWLTLALDWCAAGVEIGDLMALRDWIDAGCIGEPPEPTAGPR